MLSRNQLEENENSVPSVVLTDGGEGGQVLLTSHWIFLIFLYSIFLFKSLDIENKWSWIKVSLRWKIGLNESSHHTHIHTHTHRDTYVSLAVLFTTPERPSFSSLPEIRTSTGRWPTAGQVRREIPGLQTKADRPPCNNNNQEEMTLDKQSHNIHLVHFHGLTTDVRRYSAK